VPEQRGSAITLEAEVLEGLLPLAEAEAAELGFIGFKPVTDTSAQFRVASLDAPTYRQLSRARLVVAFHQLLRFRVPRPRALLGDEHFRRLTGAARQLQQLGGHRSFRISAAGADSAVFQRLTAEFSRSTGLRHDPDEGELLLRFRRSRDGWEVLLRLTPRPLSARAWRVCNLEGGLNATIAAAMNRLLLEGRDSAEGVYLNAMCGSGTLLAEWCALTGRPATGFDLSASALDCARDNLAELHDRVELFQADAAAVPRPDASFTFISSDPPWGDDIGNHEDNARLYPAFLAEAERLLVPGGRLVLLSHEIKLLRRLLPQTRGLSVRRELRVWHGGHRPGIWLLQKQ